jgi:hypothetical protein
MRKRRRKIHSPEDYVVSLLLEYLLFPLGICQTFMCSFSSVVQITQQVRFLLLYPMAAKATRQRPKYKICNLLTSVFHKVQIDTSMKQKPIVLFASLR